MTIFPLLDFDVRLALEGLCFYYLVKESYGFGEPGAIAELGEQYYIIRSGCVSGGLAIVVEDLLVGFFIIKVLVPREGFHHANHLIF